MSDGGEGVPGDLTLGPLPPLGERCRFRVRAPHACRVELEIDGPRPRLLTVPPERRGYFTVEAEGVPPGTLYRYRLDGRAGRAR